MTTMRAIAFSAFLALTICNNAFSRSTNFTIEDKGLHSIEGRATEAIMQDPSYAPFAALGCKITGEEIPITSSPKNATYFATTSDACGWGAAIGPIWLVDKVNRRVILSTGGYTVSIERGTRNGFRNIAVSYETAGEASKNAYVFDGTRYKPVKPNSNRNGH